MDFFDSFDTLNTLDTLDTLTQSHPVFTGTPWQPHGTNFPTHVADYMKEYVSYRPRNPPVSPTFRSLSLSLDLTHSLEWPFDTAITAITGKVLACPAQCLFFHKFAFIIRARTQEAAVQASRLLAQAQLRYMDGSFKEYWMSIRMGEELFRLIEQRPFTEIIEPGVPDQWHSVLDTYFVDCSNIHLDADIETSVNLQCPLLLHSDEHPFVLRAACIASFQMLFTGVHAASERARFGLSDCPPELTTMLSTGDVCISIKPYVIHPVGRPQFSRTSSAFWETRTYKVNLELTCGDESKKVNVPFGHPVVAYLIEISECQFSDEEVLAPRVLPTVTQLRFTANEDPSLSFEIAQLPCRWATDTTSSVLLPLSDANPLDPARRCFSAAIPSTTHAWSAWTLTCSLPARSHVHAS